MAPRRKMTRRRAPRKTTRKTRSNMSKTVRKIVKKEIARSNENKIVMINGNANTPIGNDYPGTGEDLAPAIRDNTYFRGLLPRISDGTDAFQRVGNSITPKVLKVRGLVYFNPDVIASSSWDFTLRLMVLTHKSQKNQDELTRSSVPPVTVPPSVGQVPYWNSLIWNAQTGTSVPYLGLQPYYNQLPLNRRNWNVLMDRQITLRKGLGDSAITPVSAAETFKSPTRAVPFEFVLTQKQLPAKLQYNGPGTDIPTNFAPVLAMGWVSNDGSLSVTNTVQDPTVQIQWTSSLIYEDA